MSPTSPICGLILGNALDYENWNIYPWTYVCEAIGIMALLGGVDQILRAIGL